jgi:hypothetical protein
MWQTLKDYGYTINHIPLICGNESAIKISYNSCEHSITKHIDTWHHFLRDHAIKGDLVISHVGTNDQFIDSFTKPLDEKWFRELRSDLFTQNFIHALWFKSFQGIYIHIFYSPYTKICWISIFRQFLKFLKLLRQLSPDMSSIWSGHIRPAAHVRLRARTCPGLRFPAYIRGLSIPS